MTREEREKAIEIIRKYECNAEHYEACEAIIKASEQFSVLDNVRAEMLEEMLSHSGTGEEAIQAYADGLNKGLQIIDKYKAESESNK